MDNITNDAGFDSVFGEFDDEIDCAIVRDEDMMEALTGDEHLSDEDDEDIIDININYKNEQHDADMVDIDADDIIAAERDILLNPFEDDDIIDAATDDDDYTDTDEY